MPKQPFVAYFSMEFGLHEDFKIYAGGLGVLAGDVLKAAKDLSLPMVGVGILWRQGYVSQQIDSAGRVYDSFYEHRYDFLEDTGVIVEVSIKGCPVRLKVWKCEAFGNAPLYLLDAFIKDNNAMLMSGQLYGWFEEERLAQEIILGVGGVHALEALGLNVDIYHFNDSHPVIAALELVRLNMKRGLSFKKAISAAREKIVFTTHTPVIAGNESHSIASLLYMGANAGLSRRRLKLIGSEPFGMTVAGLRLAKRANAVSKLHGETARGMWQNVPGGANIIHITNGVHTSTWQDERVRAGNDLWQTHMQLKREMIAFVNERNGINLKEDILTIGFARRAAAYKRSDLIFSDPARIEALLKSGKLQLVFSAKAHPNDMDGKAIIESLYQKSLVYPQSVVFLLDYDMAAGKILTRGCDVWLNNPIRPMEASGTSGMKAAMNGVVNLSVPDGWWPEGAVHGENGFTFGGNPNGEGDADELYDVLESEVMALFYSNREKWLGIMRSSIDMACEKFSAERMVGEYYEKMYAI